MADVLLALADCGQYASNAVAMSIVDDRNRVNLRWPSWTPDLSDLR